MVARSENRPRPTRIVEKVGFEEPRGWLGQHSVDQRAAGEIGGRDPPSVVSGDHRPGIMFDEAVDRKQRLGRKKRQLAVAFGR